jgi:hypothetical protein
VYIRRFLWIVLCDESASREHTDTYDFSTCVVGRETGATSVTALIRSIDGMCPCEGRCYEWCAILARFFSNLRFGSGLGCALLARGCVL